MEQDEYRSEGIEWVHIDYFNNEPICRMMDANPGGMYAILDEECLRPGTDNDSRVVIHMDKAFKNNEHYLSHAARAKQLQNQREFQIKHYAGVVTYNIDGFLDKNKDTQFQDLKRMLYNSEMDILKEMFPEGANALTDMTKRPITAGSHFKNEMSNLVEIVEKQEPHYVRCIMPNWNKAPREFDDELCLNQVRYLGLVENMKVRRAGYPFRMHYNRFMRRYKMIWEETWPNYKWTDEQACRKMVAHYHLNTLVSFGKTKIFIKTPRTVYYLEEQREKKMPELTLTVTRWWKGFMSRLLAKRMRGLLRVMISFRRFCGKKWMESVIEEFKNVKDMPNWGKTKALPEPNRRVLKRGHRLLEKVKHNWWAKMMILQLTPAEQYEVRLKTVAQTLLQGKKKNWGFQDRWLGDEMSASKHNSKATTFAHTMIAIQNLNKDNTRLYSARVVKLSRSLKSSKRVYVLCDLHLYRLYEDYSMKKKAPIDIGDILAISLSSGPDQAIVIHCAPTIGDCVFYIENGRPAAELAAAIWLTYHRKYKKSFPVKVMDQITYYRPGIKEGVLVFESGASTTGFRKVGGKTVAVDWPTKK
jgi:myosin-1